MYDCIIPIGCSHMYGYEHTSTNNNTQPSSDTWINLLGQHLDLPVYNCSLPGASNQTILRKLQLAINYCEQRNLNPLFILQWTEFTRYETTSNIANFIVEDWPYIRPGVEIRKASKDKNCSKWAQDFYQLFDDNTLYYETTKTIEHANAIASKYHVVNCYANCWDIPKWHTQYVEGNRGNQIVYISLNDIYKDELDAIMEHDMLKKHNVQTWNSPDTTANIHLMWKRINNYAWWKWPEHVGFKTWCVNNGLELGPEKHPMESANRIAFEYAVNDNQFMSLLKL